MAKSDTTTWANARALPGRVPPVAQTSDFSCGPAALLSVLKYWLGTDAPAREEDLRTDLKASPDTGTEPDALVAVARKYGLSASLLKNRTIDDLRASVQRGDALILLMQAYTEGGKDPASTWNEGHYAVLQSVDAERATFADPYKPDAPRHLSLADLEARWRGVDERGKNVRGLAIVVSGTGKPKGALAGAPDPSKPMK